MTCEALGEAFMGRICKKSAFWNVDFRERKKQINRKQ